ncbi:hypothetical protein DFJ77DRAFT_442250 [Powellomyces hirtus]|nr:hypothetical protein DFJ77DRAFT_442250 [Powellomyces hirtus]
MGYRLRGLPATHNGADNWPRTLDTKHERKGWATDYWTWQLPRSRRDQKETDHAPCCEGKRQEEKRREPGRQERKRDEKELKGKRVEPPFQTLLLMGSTLHRHDVDVYAHRALDNHLLPDRRRVATGLWNMSLAVRRGSSSSSTATITDLNMAIEVSTRIEPGPVPKITKVIEALYRPLCKMHVPKRLLALWRHLEWVDPGDLKHLRLALHLVGTVTLLLSRSQAHQDQAEIGRRWRIEILRLMGKHEKAEALLEDARISYSWDPRFICLTEFLSIPLSTLAEDSSVAHLAHKYYKALGAAITTR